MKIRKVIPLVLLIFGFGVVFFTSTKLAERQQVENTTTSQVRGEPACFIDEEAKSYFNDWKGFDREIEFVQKFEKYRKEKKAEELLSLFESPQNDSEKGDFEFITFADTPGASGYRLFGTHVLGTQTDYCLVTNIERNEGSVKADISEVRRKWNPSQPKNITYFDKFTLEFKPNGDSFLVTSYYYSKRKNVTSKKYEGLYTFVCDQGVDILGQTVDTSCIDY